MRSNDHEPAPIAGAPAGMSGDPLTPDALITEARHWLGTPFRHQGRTGDGLDCVGLLVVIARGLSLPHHDVTGYTRRATGMGFLDHFHAHLVEIAPGSLRPGDVSIFVETVYPCHTGLISSQHGVPHLIHAHALRGRVIEEPFAGEWADKLRFAFRFPQLQEQT